MLTDKIIFAVVVVLAGVYFYATAQIPSLEIGDPLGPKAFPRLLGIGLLIAAFLLLGEILRAGKQRQGDGAAAEPAAAPHWGVLAGSAAWTAVYFASFTTLGYMISTALFLVGMMAWFNRGRWRVNIATSVLFSVISYFMFTKLLGVGLAQGFLPF